MRYLKLLTLLFSLFCALEISAQEPIMMHSHNDYDRSVPFYQAYSQKIHSIETDLFIKDGKLLVGHNWEDLREDFTFEGMYVEPIVKLFNQNKGKAWKDSNQILQLMIDLKTRCEETLPAIVDVLDDYPEVFNPKVNKNAARVVITGNFPNPEDFDKYPDFIFYDGRLNIDYTTEQLNRVYLFSGDFDDFAPNWNGKGNMIKSEEEAVIKAVDMAHAMGKPIRFWGTPESVTMYYTFFNMGVDYINTDYPEACAAFFSDFPNKVFMIGEERKGERVTGTKRLDKTTRDFAGFSNDKLQLTKGIEVYEPTYKSDGKKGKIKNVIFLIGDGMGLNQIMAGSYANKGLSILNMRYLGLQTNHPKDGFTSDSAAGGSALATGVRHNNRAISQNPDGTSNKALTDFFHEEGYATGILTLGNVADATPAAFYGHSIERDSARVLLNGLLEGHVDCLCGSGADQFKDEKFMLELKKQYKFVTDINKINEKDGKVICIDNRMEKAAEEANLSLLAESVGEVFKKLQNESNKGFFLMIEGAKIDYAGHSKCLPGTVIEMLSFDLAVAEALKFADKNGETLVIVTGDHETGGLVLLNGHEETGRIMGVFVTDDHTPLMLPVFAYGPHADSFIGTYKNTEIPNKIRALIK